MPSGAKKRKAAKKKKEMEASHNSNSSAITHPHGDDDLKHHDEKENDGGEVSSPASQDHHSHQHSFSEGEDEKVEKKEDTSSVQSVAKENNSMEGVNNYGEGMPKTAVEVTGVVQIDREVKPEDESESKDIEYVEPVNKSHHGGSSGSSSSTSNSSSSDDESHAVEKSSVVMETGSLVELAKPVDSSSKVMTQVPNCIPPEEAYNSLVKTAPVVSVVEEVSRVNENASIGNSITSDIVESELKENSDKKFPSLVESTGISSIVMDLGSKEEDRVVLTLNGNSATNLDAKISKEQKNEEKLLQSYNAPRVDTSNGAEHMKESERPEGSDNQPLIASVPRPVQTSSWKSCCGLFEVFTGSNR